MSDTQDYSDVHPTQALPEHAWLHHLVGSWKTVSTYIMGPDQPEGTSSGTEVVTMFGDLWALAEGVQTMSDGTVMHSRHGLGYDVSFKEYRGFWVVTASSHLWKTVGSLSEDGKVMTLLCEGPDMLVDGKTALYKDVIELVDANHRTLTSSGQDAEGNWVEFMKVHYTKA